MPFVGIVNPVRRLFNGVFFGLKKSNQIVPVVIRRCGSTWLGFWPVVPVFMTVFGSKGK